MFCLEKNSKTQCVFEVFYKECRCRLGETLIFDNVRNAKSAPHSVPLSLSICTYIYTRFYRLATLRRYNIGRMAPTVPAATAISVNGERGTGAARSGRLPGVAGATSFDGLPTALRRTMFVLFLRVTRSHVSWSSNGIRGSSVS